MGLDTHRLALVAQGEPDEQATAISVTATNNQPAGYPPRYLLPTPKTTANGRTASDDNQSGSG